MRRPRLYAIALTLVLLALQAIGIIAVSLTVLFLPILIEWVIRTLRDAPRRRREQ